MAPGDRASADDAKLAPELAVVQPKPVLFLHIPKTAGTSFLLMLQNAFGDNRVRRLKTVEPGVKEAVDAIIAHELGGISCLTGHLPLHLFAGRLDLFQPFTVLRDPVARVRSLFRFLKAGDPGQLKRLGLRPESTLAEFLASPHAEIHGQVNNGMVRMLCGDPRMENPDCPEFWDPNSELPALNQALANLERLDFGLCEQMGRTLELARARWSAPYALREYKENTTKPDDNSATTADLRNIILKNTRDLALYKQAETLFARRLRALPQTFADEPSNPLAVFAAPANERVSVADIAGRQGFHEFERDGFSWLHFGQAAEINFTFAASSGRLVLHFYCIRPDYPAADIVLRLNGRPLQHTASFPEPRWARLETEIFKSAAGLNRLEIEAPLFVQAASSDPSSKDGRKLGVALANILVRA